MTAGALSETRRERSETIASILPTILRGLT
jgi:hypothetical protein